MSDTGLDHPLVRDYLHRLDTELKALSPAQAAELREQIRSHLDEELPPAATDDEVADAIRRLGTPAEVATAAGKRSRPELSAGDVGRWLARLLTRRTWRFWTATAAVLVAVGIPAGLLVRVESAPALSFGGGSAWLYRRDWLREVDTAAYGARQTAVPLRLGQRQGFAVSIYNDSGWTQTVIGLWAPGEYLSGVGNAARLDISARVFAHGDPGDPRSAPYALPVSIPPGQSRWLRLTWISACEDPIVHDGINQVTLLVRVGWVTRTEVISLDQGWFLYGTKQSRCLNG